MIPMITIASQRSNATTAPAATKISVDDISLSFGQLGHREHSLVLVSGIRTLLDLEHFHGL